MNLPQLTKLHGKEITMIKQVATINADRHYEELVYTILTDIDWVMCCRRSSYGCGSMFIFGPSEIDRTKALPHIKCPSCDKMLQLPSKYLHEKEIDPSKTGRVSDYIRELRGDDSNKLQAEKENS